MLSEQNLNIVNGNISTGIVPNDSINAVIEFIKNNFKGFSTFYKSKKANNEKGLIGLTFGYRYTLYSFKGNIANARKVNYNGLYYSYGVAINFGALYQILFPKK